MLVGIDGTCRLSDFGIAKAAAAVAPRGGVATHGKPAYLSPEQAEGRSFDRRVDIFSLGVVMWNALTGERLFDGADVKATLANVREKEIPLPSTVGLRPPACLDAICLQALARDPAVRYQSAEEMAADLRAVAIREELLAPSSDVARWVTSTFGEELQVRRLAVLDASRRAKAAGTTRSETLEADRASDPEVKEEPVPSAPPSGEASHTIILAHDKRKNRVVLGAAMLSVLVVIFALAWPNQLAKLFKLETARPSESKPSSFAPNLPSIRANRADTNPAPAPSGTVAETAPPTHVRVPSPKSETQ
jgi:serine/threonine-protein kinase